MYLFASEKQTFCINEFAISMTVSFSAILRLSRDWLVAMIMILYDPCRVMNHHTMHCCVIIMFLSFPFICYTYGCEVLKTSCTALQTLSMFRELS